MEDDVNNFNENIDIDELYDKKKKSDLKYLENYNKILNQVHKQIKKYSKVGTYCMFTIPLHVIGISKYKQSHCIAYLLDKLTKNGFRVKYIYPNLLFISWEHLVPTYVREEIKKRTGIEIDKFGKEIIKEEKEEEENIEEIKENKSSRKYEQIKKYIPKGRFDF